MPSSSCDQREEVIQQPIEKAHATIEPELVQQLLNDSGDDIDQLPVLQHCLLRVWEAAGAAGASRAAAEGPSRADVAALSRRWRHSPALSNHADEIRRELTNTGLAVEQLGRSPRSTAKAASSGAPACSGISSPKPASRWMICAR